MGTQRFLYKVSAEKRCNTAWTTFFFMGTVAVLSLIFFLGSGEAVSDRRYLLVIGLINSGTFSMATITHMESLKHIPASVAYSIIRLNMVIVVLFSIIHFEDKLSYFQIAGVVTAIAVFIILTGSVERKEVPTGNMKHGLLLVMISTLSGAVSSITSKFAAVHTNMLAYMAVSYIASTVFSFGMRNRLQTEEVTGNRKMAMIIGLVMGLINFGGYFLFLKALSMGPLSLVAPITGMAFVMAIILSALFYKEKLTPLRILGISMTLMSVILMRL